MRRLFRRIKRVIGFLPIIWKGYDWDYRYAIELFQYQLKRTANEIEKNGYHLHKANDVSRIRTAIDLMDKVYDEKYMLEYIEEIERKYGKSELEFKKLDTLDENGDPYYEMVEVFKNNYTEEELLIIYQEKDALMWESRAKQKKAHKLLWSYIEHNIQGWWD
jgi:hypothetical protein